MVIYRARFRRACASRFKGTLGAISAMALLAAQTSPALANNLGENGAWQFRTSADKANQAAILDLIAKHRGGYYAAPIYNTNIARQVNCSIGATATGNSGGQSAVANAPTVTGATSTAVGNQNGTSVDAGRGGGSSSSQQANSGQISSGVTGGTQTAVQGSPSQVLNSTQSNSGSQNASVEGSTGCSFAALN